MNYFEASAKMNFNVDEAFQYFLDQIYDGQCSKLPIPYSRKSIKLHKTSGNAKKDSRKNCCSGMRKV